MKVKVGDKVFDSEKEPIMLILSHNDRELIKMMKPEAHKYCTYPRRCTQEEIEAFMEKGRNLL